MAKKSTATGNMSDAIREYLKAHPKATQKEVAAGLAEQGVKVSASLINKIKYGKPSAGRKAKAGRRRKAGRSGSAATHASSTPKGNSKAQAIRDAFAALGQRTRPRDVIAHLLEKGTKVSAAQVSAMRKSLRKRGRTVRGALPAAAASREHYVSREHLLAAKKLADQVGLEAARRALDLLAQLVN